MARNWTVKEAIEILESGTDIEAITDIGRRCPLFVYFYHKSSQVVIKAMGKNMTAKNANKRIDEFFQPEVEEEELEGFDKKVKKTKKEKVKKEKVEEDDDDEIDDDDDDDDNDEDNDNEEELEDEIDDDEDEEEEVKKEKVKKTKKEKVKKTKKEKGKKEKVEEEDDNLDFDVEDLLED